jgi:hypothetical protein
VLILTSQNPEKITELAREGLKKCWGNETENARSTVPATLRGLRQKFDKSRLLLPRPSPQRVILTCRAGKTNLEVEDGETRGLSAFAFEKFLLVSALSLRGLIGLIDSNLETILLWGQSKQKPRPCIGTALISRDCSSANDTSKPDQCPIR